MGRTDLRIHRALPADHQRLSAIAMVSKAHWGYSPRQLEAWHGDLVIDAATIADCPTYAGRVLDIDIGFYSLIPGPEVFVLDYLFVLPSHVRCGIGTALISHAMAIAGRAGAAAISIDAEPFAAPFYARMGATLLGFIEAPAPGLPDRRRPQFMLRVAHDA